MVGGRAGASLWDSRIAKSRSKKPRGALYCCRLPDSERETGLPFQITDKAPPWALPQACAPCQPARGQRGARGGVWQHAHAPKQHAKPTPSPPTTGHRAALRPPRRPPLHHQRSPSLAQEAHAPSPNRPRPCLRRPRWRPCSKSLTSTCFLPCALWGSRVPCRRPDMARDSDTHPAERAGLEIAPFLCSPPFVWILCGFCFSVFAFRISASTVILLL